MNSTPLIFDIETVPENAEAYKEAFPKSKKKPGLHAIISTVVAIGYKYGQYAEVLMGDERDILCDFASVLESKDALIGFNIKNFDIPLLQIRAAKHGVMLNFPDRRSQRILDIYEVLGGKWQSDISSCSLAELNWFLYGKGKSSQGSEIAKMWEDGDLDGIRSHCAEDVDITFRVYEEFKGVLW